MFLIIFILGEIILIILIVYQMELKRRVLFSTLYTLSINTIPEEETDYLFDSSSDEIELNNISSESNFETGSNDSTSNLSSEVKTEENFISEKSKLDLDLDLISQYNAPSCNSSNLIKTLTDTGIQTQLSDFEKVIHSDLKADIRTKADLLEFGTKQNILPDSKFLIDKAVQTKPELQIDLSSTSFDIEKELTSKSILDFLPQNIDPLLLEAYLPVPELTKTYEFLAYANGCFW